MKRSSLHSVIALLFVVSGAVGLIYQVVWFKYLSMFLGNTTYAQTIVLASFMGGLAIGSAIWGRRADREPNPLRLYAILELGIGIYCAVYPLLIDLVRTLFVRVAVGMELPSGGWALMSLKLLASLGTLLLPTILMGGTLPILVRFTSQHLEDAGRNVAILYFLNSLGAVLGAGLAGFFMIRIIGLSASIYGGAAVSVTIGLAAVVLSKLRIQPGGDERSGGGKDPAGQEMVYPERQVLVATAVAGISGMASMIYEVTWVRLLIPVLGSSTYSFTLMLVGFIAGITLGSLIVSSVVHRVKDLYRLLGWCQLAIAASLVLTVPLYARIPYTFWTVAEYLNRSDATYPIFLTLQLCFSILIMILPTIFLGMSLPLATRIAARGIRVLGRSVGNVFSVNTLGTVLGSLGAGLVLIPLVGVKRGLEFGILLNLGAGLMVLWTHGGIPRLRRIVVTAGSVVVVGVYALLSPQWSRGAMLTGVFRQVNSNLPPPESYAEFSAVANQTNVVFYEEGTTATVGVVEGVTPRGPEQILVINGKADASSRSDLPTQTLLGEIPLLLHPSPKNVLLVGLGSGVTAGSILRHPVERLDCVEISPEVVEASKCFDTTSHAPLSDPRMHLHVEDALAYLNIVPRSYDVIISEPSNPWIAGIGSLFTTDFFASCRKRMNPDGMMIQWFHMYEIDDELFRLVLRTFHASFPRVSIWQTMSTDVVLIGTDRKVVVDEGEIARRLQNPAVASDLRRIDIEDARTLLSLQMVSHRAIVEEEGAGLLNTEDHPLLEYSAPRAFYVNKGVTDIFRADERLSFEEGGIALRSAPLIGALGTNDMLRIGLLHVAPNRGNPVFGFSVLREYLQRNPRDTMVIRRMVETAERFKRMEDAMTLSARLAELRPDDPDALWRYGWLRYSYERSRANSITGFSTAEYEQLIRRSIKIVSDTVDRYRVALADMFFGTQRYDLASDQYARSIQIRASHTPDPAIRDDVLFLQLSHCLFELDRVDKAMGYAFQAVQLNPHNTKARDFLYQMWTMKRDSTGAIDRR